MKRFESSRNPRGVQVSGRLARNDHNRWHFFHARQFEGEVAPHFLKGLEGREHFCGHGCLPVGL